MSDSDSDSDSDEIQIKQYFNNDLLSAIKQAKYAQESHGGIKRAPGRHKLRNKKQVVMEKKITAYTGTHWDVDADNRLERATRRMTIHTINGEVNKEQLRRVKEDKKNREKAGIVLHKINHEFWNNVTLSERRQVADEMDERHEVEQHVEDVKNQLIRRHTSKTLNVETELEKERQLKLLISMKDKNSRTPSQEDLLMSMAENNQKRSTVQTDLLEAFARYEEDEGDVDSEYDAAMFEVMDESLNSLTQMFSRQKSRRLSLDEQNRRIRDLNGLMKDSAFQSSMSSYNKVMGNLRNAFQRVWKQEEEIDAETKRLAVERRLLMQEQLVRKHATKWVNAASAKERQRQIQDFEVSRYKSDPFRDAVKLALAKAQREMILQKFNGKWVDTRATPGDGTPKEELSEYDKRMKAMRMKSRRKSCVVRPKERAAIGRFRSSIMYV